ncbi:hypothetical protein ACWEBX_03120 [Streptomyces sp. NPDC005070]
MPKKNPSTAAQRARQRQAATGEKYTTALRAETRPAIRRPAVAHTIFSAVGEGWAPIIRQAEHELREVWPGHPVPYWQEKFGDLCWKSVPYDAAPEVHAVIRRAAREASVTCQTCPSPGRKRVVTASEIMPWVKTCCEACYYVDPHMVRTDRWYRDLVQDYEIPWREARP